MVACACVGANVFVPVCVRAGVCVFGCSLYVVVRGWCRCPWVGAQSGYFAAAASEGAICALKQSNFSDSQCLAAFFVHLVGHIEQGPQELEIAA